MSGRPDLVICGDIVTPSGILEGGWLAISGDTIAALGTGAPPEAGRTERYGNALVLPGAIDGQVHACSAGGLAGLKPTTRSAAAGGITTIVDMPYDDPEPLQTVAELSRKVEAIEELASVDVALYATVPRKSCDVVLDLVAAGCCAVKISHFESHPTRFPCIPMDETLDLLEVLAPTNIPVGLHNEDQEIVLARIARFKAEGRIGAEYHSPSRPEAAELVDTAAFLELGAVTGAHVHIVHISTPRGYDLVRHYAESGHRATGEMCAHYLHFDAEIDIPRLGNLLKVNPPIRAGVKEKLWERYARGDFAFISSDHGSWPLERKLTASAFDAGAGITGLETLVLSYFTDLSERFADPAQRLARDLSENPARFFGLYPRKGVLQPGSDADVTVLARGPVQFDASGTQDGLNWSPYDKEMFAASIAATYVRGKQVFDGKNVAELAGHGRFVRRH
ncbi:MAG: dihydroorotase [Devosia sp.]